MLSITISLYVIDNIEKHIQALVIVYHNKFLLNKVFSSVINVSVISFKQAFSQLFLKTLFNWGQAVRKQHGRNLHFFTVGCEFARKKLQQVSRASIHKSKIVFQVFFKNIIC